ncbi:MAG: DNA translocase FtsK 4TM domain-containing protein [Candidatus Pacebacteria bacterium]|nr:DNA translocase FtsK 4TM domain-containing protein [Candidatus Paceibacterota bacterium]
MTKKNQKEKKASNPFAEKVRKNKYTTIILLFLFAFFLGFAAFDLGGVVGNFVHKDVVMKLFGYGFPLVPLILVSLGIFRIKDRPMRLLDYLGFVLITLSVTALLDVFIKSSELLAGGVIGHFISSFVVGAFDVYFSVLLFIAITLISLFAIFDPNMESIARLKKEIEAKRKARAEMLEERYREREARAEAEMEIEEDDEEREETAEEPEEEIEEEPEEEKESSKFSIAGIIGKKKKSEEDELPIEKTYIPSTYTPPPLSLLNREVGKPSTGDIKSNSQIIKRTLANFGISVEMGEIDIGPSVTRYTLKPAQGVRLSRIASLQNELALALAAKSIRIEAPIPGRSLVGIEVPNAQKASVGLGALLSEKDFQENPAPLYITLGRGISGKSHFVNISKMPHALIAGATGAGKSVTIHNIILSLLYRNGPDMLRFIMVDPKRVEMTLYKKIPHLLTPVITDPKKAVLALKWAVREMERRLEMLQQYSVRDIQSYHKSIVQPAYKDLDEEEIESMQEELPEKMPFIVVIIDELSDIMSSYPRELEASIVRLAQMSRAVGIHLLLATQRPSVNVITGIIKANVPTRLAMKVTSQIDSRTILDSAGAEKLLGYGDMLYKGEGANEPIRIQCPFVSEEEVKKVVAYLQKNHRYDLDDTISLPDEQINDGTGGILLSDDESEDPLLEDAIAAVREADKASTSYLQRKLAIGYSRAARIMDILEERRIISPADGSKAREVYSEEETKNRNEEYGNDILSS